LAHFKTGKIVERTINILTPQAGIVSQELPDT